MRIAIIGAGITGLTAAFDLLKAGHAVSLYEANHFPGGLAAGFKDERWEWPLEFFYHHLFKSDHQIISLVKELGIGSKLFWPRPITSVIYDEKIVPFDSPKSWITYPGFNLLDVARFGLISAYLRFSSPWRSLEKYSADQWMRRWYGKKIYETTWRPLLIGKFGPYFEEANMAWMWARLKVRSPRLGYFEGGFQFFVDKLTAAVEEKGGLLKLNCPVEAITPAKDDTVIVSVKGERNSYDHCLVTTSPGLLSRLAPSLPDSYLSKLNKLKSMGAVVLVLALKNKLLRDTYWLNLPAVSPDKASNDYPFLALVEHTNYIDRRHYGGDHIIYCGDYVTPGHPYLSMPQRDLENNFLAILPKFNPEFNVNWVRKSWLFRTPYAQPVPQINHSKNIPEIQTPIKNLFFAGMSQVYPWDRGTNYAVGIGHDAARLMLESL